jgi:hypothetical protein
MCEIVMESANAVACCASACVRRKPTRSISAASTLTMPARQRLRKQFWTRYRTAWIVSHGPLCATSLPCRIADRDSLQSKPCTFFLVSDSDAYCFCESKFFPLFCLMQTKTKSARVSLAGQPADHRAATRRQPHRRPGRRGAGRSARHRSGVSAGAAPRGQSGITRRFEGPC